MTALLNEDALHEVELLEVGYSMVTDTGSEPLRSTSIDDSTVQFLRLGFSSSTGALEGNTTQGTLSVPPCPKLRRLRLAQGSRGDLDPELFGKMLETRFKHGMKLELNLGLWIWGARRPEPLELTSLYTLHQQDIFTLTVDQVGDLAGVEWFKDEELVSMPVLKQEYALNYE
ncbi:hypothetical protein BDV98DRAFT_589211 [Pterulicium gracile]|uniref:Uncharacterized protein n=1 Tax=Pterulicium gracile TaxID=1884261 RepID=A0A5C3QZ77_9AGAR|nr:hypothetical protein BDV98DRAFT_589211 [Pterula gracilis]